MATVIGLDDHDANAQMFGRIRKLLCKRIELRTRRSLCSCIGPASISASGDGTAGTVAQGSGVALVGVSGALSWWAPVQPFVGLLAVALLVYTLRKRFNTYRLAACPVPV